MKAHIEPILPDQNSSFRSFRIEAEQFDYPYHLHPEVEITLILSGVGTVIMGDCIRSFQPGDLFLIGPKLPHVFFNKLPTGSIPKSSIAEVLQFRQSDWSFLTLDLPESKGILQLLDKSACGLFFKTNSLTIQRIEKKMISVREDTGLSRIGNFILLLQELLTIPAATMASHATFEESPAFASERINKICNYLVQHFDDPISHEVIAKNAGMAPAAFSRLFKKITDQTFTDFLSRIRLNHAAKLLFEADYSITDVCMYSGFHNLSNFNRRFKQYYGVTPKSYRSAHLRASA